MTLRLKSSGVTGDRSIPPSVTPVPLDELLDRWAREHSCPSCTGGGE